MDNYCNCPRRKSLFDLYWSCTVQFKSHERRAWSLKAGREGRREYRLKCLSLARSSECKSIRSDIFWLRVLLGSSPLNWHIFPITKIHFRTTRKQPHWKDKWYRIGGSLLTPIIALWKSEVYLGSFVEGGENCVVAQEKSCCEKLSSVFAEVEILISLCLVAFCNCRQEVGESTHCNLKKARKQYLLFILWYRL